MIFHKTFLMVVMFFGVLGSGNSMKLDELDCKKLPTTFRSTVCEVSDALFKCCKSPDSWPCSELNKLENTTKDILCGGVVFIEDSCCDSTVKRRAFSRLSCSSLSTADRAVLCEVTDLIGECCKVSTGVCSQLWNLENKTKDLVCEGVDFVENKCCNKFLINEK